MLQVRAVGVPLTEVNVITTGVWAATAQEEVPPHWLAPLAKVAVLAPLVTAVRSEPRRWLPLSVPVVPSARLSRFTTTLVLPCTAQNARVRWIAVAGLRTMIRPESPTTGARSVIVAVRVSSDTGRSAVATDAHVPLAELSIDRVN